MKTIVRFFGLASLAGLLLMLEGGPALHAGGRATNADVSILSFGSVIGELAPCG